MIFNTEKSDPNKEKLNISVYENARNLFLEEVTENVFDKDSLSEREVVILSRLFDLIILPEERGNDVITKPNLKSYFNETYYFDSEQVIYRKFIDENSDNGKGYTQNLLNEQINKNRDLIRQNEDNAVIYGARKEVAELLLEILQSDRYIFFLEKVKVNFALSKPIEA